MPKNHKKVPKRAKSTKKCSMFGPFWHLFWNIYKFSLSQWLSATNKNLFVAVTQCNKQNKFLLQWLSATKSTEKISNFFVLCDQWIEKNKKNKHSFKSEFHHHFQIALGYLLYTLFPRYAMFLFSSFLCS